LFWSLSQAWQAQVWLTPQTWKDLGNCWRFDLWENVRRAIVINRREITRTDPKNKDENRLRKASIHIFDSEALLWRPQGPSKDSNDYRQPSPQIKWRPLVKLVLAMF
jgi:hypothetical protein